MLDWLKRKKTPGGLPEYSSVRKTPSRKLPDLLVQQEASDQYQVRREQIESSLRESSERPSEDSSLFVEILDVTSGGVLTMNLPEGEGQCLPAFTSPFRAADYARCQLSSSDSLGFQSSSPLDLVQMLGDLRDAGIQSFALDRCPRCDIFDVVGSASFSAADRAVDYWTIKKATEYARLELYLSFARWSATSGEFEIAREVGLETVGHVSVEDPSAHFLLGQLAVALRDRKLLGEAKAFLQFFQLERWEQKLDEVVKTREPDFEWLPEAIN